MPLSIYLFIYLDFIYLFMRDPERERSRDTGKGEAGSMWKTDVGLHPGAPGSRPEPKAGDQPLSHPGIPYSTI